MNKELRDQAVAQLAEFPNTIHGHHCIVTLGEQACFMNDYPQGTTFYCSLYPYAHKGDYSEYQIEFSQSVTTGYVLVTGSYLTEISHTATSNKQAVHHVKLLMSQVLRFFRVYQGDESGLTPFEIVTQGEPMIMANCYMINKNHW